MSDCEHKHRRIRWEKNHTSHYCKLCHETWTEPRMTRTGLSDHEAERDTSSISEDGGEVS